MAKMKKDKIENIVPSPSTFLTVAVENENQLINGNFDGETLFYQSDKGHFFAKVGNENKLLIGSIKFLLSKGKIKKIEKK